MILEMIMIEFECKRYKSKVPMVKDEYLDNFASAIIQDYREDLLLSPQSLDYQDFAEFYLSANLEFQHIFYKQGESQILGASSFNDGDKLKIFDRENMCATKISLKKNTIVLDVDVCDMSRGVEKFTGLHECSHLLAHKNIYERSPQLDMFGYIDGRQYDKVACCRRKDFFPTKTQLETPHDFIEHQANFLAAALAMPKESIVPFAKKILKSLGYNDGYIELIGSREIEDVKTLKAEIADIYEMSKQCAGIRLKKLGIILD